MTRLMAFCLAWLAISAMACEEYIKPELTNFINESLSAGNYKMTATLLNELIKLGDPLAMADMGDLYLTGKGVDKNDERAIYSYIDSALKHCGKGYEGIGYMFILGRHVEKSLTKGYAFLKVAQARGRDSANEYIIKLINVLPEAQKATGDKLFSSILTDPENIIGYMNQDTGNELTAELTEKFVSIVRGAGKILGDGVSAFSEELVYQSLKGTLLEKHTKRQSMPLASIPEQNIICIEGIVDGKPKKVCQPN